MSINTSKERFLGDRWFKQHCAPPGWDCHMRKNELSPYFAARGFKVPMTYDAFFSAYNGIESDRYLSPDLYFMYVVPALNRMEFRKAYSDKSFYPVLFPGIRQPEIVVICASGRYYDRLRAPVSKEYAVNLCLSEPGSLIVKPSIDTGEGVGVDLLDTGSAEGVNKVFSERECGAGFIVQRFFKQHTALNRINASSVNTMRLFTYRRQNGEIVNVWRQNFLRFGGTGAWKDNVSCDGGFCHVHEDGMLDGKVLTKAVVGAVPFGDRFPFKPFAIPSFDRAVDFVKELHSRLLYFDSIGWDIAIAEDGEPCLIEFNIDANLRSAQMIGGPMFGEYIDEVMDRIESVKRVHIGCDVNVFRHGYDRWTQTEGPEYDVL